MTDQIPAVESSVIGGDFNAHCALWDEIQSTDDRGEALVDWMLNNNLEVLNNGEPTRSNPDTGNGSSPDVSFCGSRWKGKVEWKIVEAIGSSDHLPKSAAVHKKI